MPNRPPPAQGQRAHRSGPEASEPPTGRHNPDPASNSSYPAGGKQEPAGKDAYGRPRKPARKTP
ncbi:hypothetical protein [Bordetella parapertussis]|uniref:hypothetical protein n=1 Tax=Bordetella parapertussis TaxID=519 RepID=UPI0002EDCBB5|nr:hypothetical protein [Bordetella parapertussis]